MKRVKRIFSVIMVMCVLISSNGVFAVDHSYESKKLDAAEKCLNDLEHNHDICTSEKTEEVIIGTRETCSNCGLLAYITCAGDAKSEGEFTHKYGLFNTKTCTFVGLTSRAALICASCYTIMEWYDYHPCWEVHRDCGRGQYDICYMPVS